MGGGVVGGGGGVEWVGEGECGKFQHSPSLQYSTSVTQSLINV